MLDDFRERSDVVSWVTVLADCMDSVRVPDNGLLLRRLPSEVSAPGSMSVLCFCKLCLLRGKLWSDTDCRLVRDRFAGRAFSARRGRSFSELRGRFGGLVLARSCCPLEAS